MFQLVDVLVENMSDVFPEIKINQANIKKIIKAEEESFNATLDRGIELFENITSSLSAKNLNVIPGEEAFKLYDTYGFPFDLTNVMAREKGFSVEEDKFNLLMSEQRERARKSTRDKLAGKNLQANINTIFPNIDGIKSMFTGYETLYSEAEIISVQSDGNVSYLILDQTPFYAESGGQADDRGIIQIEDTHLKVTGLMKYNSIVIHVVDNEEAFDLKVGDKVYAIVDPKRRWDIMRNHSATHFLHKALRQILGTHVQQSGSLVAPDRLRFDFNHFEKMTTGELEAVESLVNEKILENIDLTHHRNIPFDKAKTMGAMMFFGDKYGDKVNVVQFGDFTLEFCGGTHVKNSSQIGLFKIISESSISSGVRRIEAVTGRGIEKYIQTLSSKLAQEEIKLNQALEEKKTLEKEISELLLKSKLGGIQNIVANPEEVESIKIYKAKVDGNMDELKAIADELRVKIQSGVGLLVSVNENKVSLVCIVTDDLIKSKKLLAGNLVKEASQIVGGSGGGRPHLATAGGKDISKIDEMFSEFNEIVKSFL